MVLSTSTSNAGLGLTSHPGALGPGRANPSVRSEPQSDPLVPHLAVVASLPIGNFDGAPTTVVYDSENGYVYVPNYLARNLTIVDGLATLTGLSVPGNPVSAVFDPGNGWVYVPLFNTSSMVIVNGTAVQAKVPTGSCSGAPAYDPSNGYVYVPDSCSGQVRVVDGASVVATVQLSGTNSTNLRASAVYDPANGLVYVSDPAQPMLYAINGTSFVATVAVGSWPLPGAIDPANGLLYVTDSGPGDVSVVQNTTVLATLSIGGGSYAGGFAYPGTFDSANQLVYVPYQPDHGPAGVAVINNTSVETSLSVGPLIAGTSTYGPYGNGTGFVYESTSESLNGGAAAGTVTAIGGTSVVGTLNLTSEPSGGAWDPANDYLYLPTYTPANATTGEVSDYVVVVACSGCTSVTVAETGATTGTAWGLTVQNTTDYAEEQATTAPGAVHLELLPGNYSVKAEGSGTLALSVVGGNATYSPTSGVLTVGRPPDTFGVTFTESGLPTSVLARSGWTVVLNGAREHGTTRSLGFPSVESGLYSLLVTGPSGYSTPVRATEAVTGTTSVPVAFTKGRTLTLTFDQKGLPKGEPWSVQVAGWTLSSAKASLTFSNLTPGNYTYGIVSPLSGQNVTAKTGSTPLPTSGVLGLDRTEKVSLKFSYPYAVTFTESGAPAGTWSVTMDKRTLSNSTGDPITFEVANGTYAYKVGLVPGFASAGAPKKATVTGAPASVLVTFTEKTGRSSPGIALPASLLAAPVALVGLAARPGRGPRRSAEP